MCARDFREALKYFKSVEKDKGGKPLLSFGEWLKFKRETAKVAKHKTERFVGTETPTTPTEEGEFECPTCSNAKENVLDALGVLDHYRIPPELGDAIQKWIKETWG